MGGGFVNRQLGKSPMIFLIMKLAMMKLPPDNLTHDETAYNGIPHDIISAR